MSKYKALSMPEQIALQEESQQLKAWVAELDETIMHAYRCYTDEKDDKAAIRNMVSVLSEYADYHRKDVSKNQYSQQPIGGMHDKDSLFLHQKIGSAESEGIQYEMTIGFNTGHPIVRSSKTQKYFSLSWKDIVELAIKAGINEEGPDKE